MEKKLQKLMEETWELAGLADDIKMEIRRLYGTLAIARHKIAQAKGKAASMKYFKGGTHDTDSK